MRTPRRFNKDRCGLRQKESFLPSRSFFRVSKFENALRRLSSRVDITLGRSAIKSRSKLDRDTNFPCSSLTQKISRRKRDVDWRSIDGVLKSVRAGESSKIKRHSTLQRSLLTRSCCIFIPSSFRPLFNGVSKRSIQKICRSDRGSNTNEFYAEQETRFVGQGSERCFFS